MVKVNVISRSTLEWTKDRVGEVPRAHRNYDPKQNPMAKETEYTRAVRAAKLDRMFAKPFVSALSGHNDTIKCISTDPSNVSVIASGAADGGLCIWDLMKRKPKYTIQAHKNSIDGIVITPDGVACFTASRDRVVRMWDMDMPSTDNDNYVAEYLGKNSFTSIDHHLKKSEFVTTGSSIDIWDVNRTQPIHTFSWGDDTVQCCRYNKVETDLIAACMTDRGVMVYDTRTRAGHTKVVMELQCESVVWSPIDPNLFVVGSTDWNTYLFDMRAPGRPRSVFQGHVSSVTSVDFAPTGTHFCAGSTDNTVRIWSLNQHSKVDSIEVFHTKRMAKVYSVKWSLDNNYIFSGSEDAIVRVWKADASKPIRPLVGPEKRSFNYMRSLKEKFRDFPEVKKIIRQRNTPKHIKKTQMRSRKMQIRETVKEMSRKHSDKLVPLAKRKVVQSLK